MNRFSTLSLSIAVLTICTARPAGAVPPPQAAPFEYTVVVRDVGMTAVFAWLTPDALRNPPTSIPSITFYNGDTEVAELTYVPVTVLDAASGLVYAAPRSRLSSTDQSNIYYADSVVLSMGFPFLQIRDAELTYSSATMEFFFSEYGYGTCPHCVEDFMCQCLSSSYGVRAKLDFCGAAYDPYLTCIPL